MHRPNRNNSANRPRPLEQLVQGIVIAGQDAQRRREERIENEVSRRVAEQRAVDSAANSLGRIFEDIARENERKRAEAQRAKLAAERAQLQMQQRELEQQRKEQQQRELLFAANEDFGRENYKDACAKYLRLNNCSIEVNANLETCYKKLNEEVAKMVAEIEQLIKAGNEGNLITASDKLEEAKSIFNLMPITQRKKPISLQAAADRLKFATDKLKWDKKRVKLKQEIDELLSQSFSETNYEDVINKLEILLAQYKANSELFSQEDHSVLARLQTASGKYKDLYKVYKGKLANQETCKQIEECLANLATCLGRHKLSEAKVALDTAAVRAKRLRQEYDGITEQQRIYLDPHYFTVMSEILDPQVGKFEERRREFVQQNIAGQIIDGAIENFNQTNKTVYQSKDLYQRHYNRLKRKIDDQVLQEWHKFDQRAFPDIFVATLTDKIAIEIKVIGWGKWTGSLWRSEGWKYISISSIGGGGAYGCGLLERLEQAINSFTPSEPVPNKVFLQGISIPVAETVGSGAEVVAPPEPSSWSKLLLQGV